MMAEYEEETETYVGQCDGCKGFFEARTKRDEPVSVYVRKLPNN